MYVVMFNKDYRVGLQLHTNQQVSCQARFCVRGRGCAGGSGGHGGGVRSTWLNPVPC